MNWITGIALSTWKVAQDSAPYVLLGFFMAGLLRGFLKPGILTKHLGRNNLRSVVKAALFGIPIPLCSCGVTAAAGAIRKEGASKGATAAFLIATPETGVDSISITYALLDPLFTIIRPIAAFITAVTAGFMEVWLDPDRELPPKPMLTGGHPARSMPSSTTIPLVNRLKDGFSFSFTNLLADIGPLLLGGLILAGGIAWMIPDGFFERYLGSGILSMLIMLVVGIPLYICATASTPVAAALIAKGLSPGAALVFLLAGPATNAATIGVVAKLLGKRSAVIYVISIAVCSLVLGVLLNLMYGAAGVQVEALHGHHHEMLPDWLRSGLVILLVALVIRAWLVMHPRTQAVPASAESAGHTQQSQPHKASPSLVQIGSPEKH